MPVVRLLAARWLVNPVLGGVDAVLALLVGRRLDDPPTGLVAALLWAGSAWVMTLSGTYESHVGAVTFVLLAWAALWMPAAPRTGHFLLAGLAMAAAAALVLWWVTAHPTAAPFVPAVATRVRDTVLVRFELSAPDAHDVSLAGSFNRWDAPGIPLRRSTVPGLWTVTVPLPVGEQQYLFLVDGNRWIPDPTAPAQVDDGFGRRNSVIIVGPRGVARS